MSRTPRNEVAAKEFGKRVKTLHRKAGQPSTKEMELVIYRDFGIRVSDESIRKVTRGGDDVDPTHCNIELLVGLRAYFDVSPDELGSFASRRIATVVALAGVNGPDGPGVQGRTASACATAVSNVSPFRTTRSNPAPTPLQRRSA